MQELVAITKHLEKLLRACERAAAANDLQVRLSSMYLSLFTLAYTSSCMVFSMLTPNRWCRHFFLELLRQWLRTPQQLRNVSLWHNYHLQECLCSCVNWQMAPWRELLVHRCLIAFHVHQWKCRSPVDQRTGSGLACRSDLLHDNVLYNIWVLRKPNIAAFPPGQTGDMPERSAEAKTCSCWVATTSDVRIGGSEWQPQRHPREVEWL